MTVKIFFRNAKELVATLRRLLPRSFVTCSVPSLHRWLISAMTDSSIPASVLKADRDQYHHVIPKFILRKFQVGGQMSKKERTKAFKRTGREPGEVLFYDIAARTIQTRPIATVYGVMNLYRNVRFPFNLHHLEEKLSRLESNAADVILQMHEAVDKGSSFPITRQKLGDLHQFLFLMHYRTVALSSSYTNSDHPENTLVTEQLKRFGESLALSTNSEIWLHFLHYFLDAQIAYDGTSFINEPDLANYTERDILPSNVDISRTPMKIYQRHASMFYLAACQPADGKEFILTDNGFGLWEGLSEQSHIHRIFVVGPRLAIILRNNSVDAQAIPRLNSTLVDIPLPRPTCQYSITGSDFPPRQDGDITSADQYRMSEQAQLDEFTFQITKLTSQQTFDVNSVFLLNGHDDGSVTFASKEFMMRTLECYTDPTSSSLEDPHKRRYEPALSQLRSELHRLSSPSPQTEGIGRDFQIGETDFEAELSPTTQATSSHAVGSSSTAAGPHASLRLSKRSKKLNSSTVQLAGSGAGTIAPPPSHPSGSTQASASEGRLDPFTRPVSESKPSDQHIEALDELMTDIITRKVSFSSSYEQGYKLYILFTAVQPPTVHPFAKDCDRMLSSIISRFEQLLKPPNRRVRPRPYASSPVPHPRVDQQRWDLLITLLTMLGLGSAENPRNALEDRWEEMVRGVLVVGLSTWIVKNRPDMAPSLHLA
ncbi:uncharacterized protein EV420DRAFT_1711095 [Desarmillaria tabescens]|uniref:Uncharacterized protein n=1 Tax=Armillaria tabescens TaxID=1929756 RepID=A0AA39MVT6_ARMTA|nr:uncharacterized protein EV420DRAFT_1711095 [Desarmillaria tabescens]KAK0448906.1 hypothetical protein EV420DRAFT_1711095 [Desarmillaria tabescens]